MERVHKLLLTIGIIILLVMVFYLLSSTISRLTGYVVIQENKDTCLKQQDITLFINSEDSVETLQKINAFEILQDIKIINCYYDLERCEYNALTGFPSYIINSNTYQKDLTIKEINYISGCI